MEHGPSVMTHRRAVPSTSRLPRSSSKHDPTILAAKPAALPKGVPNLAALADGSPSDAFGATGSATGPGKRISVATVPGKKVSMPAEKRKSLQNIVASPQTRTRLFPAQFPAPRPSIKAEPTLAELRLPLPPAEDPEATVRPARRILSASRTASSKPTVPKNEQEAWKRAQLPKNAPVTHAQESAMPSGAKSPMTRKVAPSRTASSPVVRISTPPAKRFTSRAWSIGTEATPSPKSSSNATSAKARGQQSQLYHFDGVSSPALALNNASKGIRAGLGSPMQLTEMRNDLSAAQDELQQARQEVAVLESKLAQAQANLTEKSQQVTESEEARDRLLASEWKALHQDYLREAGLMKLIGEDLENWRGVLSSEMM